MPDNLSEIYRLIISQGEKISHLYEELGSSNQQLEVQKRKLEELSYRNSALTNLIHILFPALVHTNPQLKKIMVDVVSSLLESLDHTNSGDELFNSALRSQLKESLRLFQGPRKVPDLRLVKSEHDDH